MADYRDWNTVRDQSGEDPMELSEKREKGMSEQIVYAEFAQVWPGCILDVQRDRVVLTLTRMTDEPLEAYVQRCNEIARYAISKSPRPEPPTFDFSDTTKYRQVGPSSWESVTPGENG